MTTHYAIVPLGASATAVSTNPFLLGATIGFAGNLTGLIPVGTKIDTETNPHGSGSLSWRTPAGGTLSDLWITLSLENGILAGPESAVIIEIWTAQSSGNSNVGLVNNPLFQLQRTAQITLGTIITTEMITAATTLDDLNIPIKRGDLVAVQVKLNDTHLTLNGTNISISGGLTLQYDR